MLLLLLLLLSAAFCCLLGAASIGVIRVDDMQQLHKAYDKVVRDLSRAKVRTSGKIEISPKFITLSGEKRQSVSSNTFQYMTRW
jgi:hypothetical protein